MTFRFTSAAQTELTQAMRYYESAEPGLGSRFMDEIDATIDRVLMAPEAWRRLSPRTRRCLVHRFPFALFYQIKKDEIVFLSVMDLRRDPVGWKKHL